MRVKVDVKGFVLNKNGLKIVGFVCFWKQSLSRERGDVYDCKEVPYYAVSRKQHCPCFYCTLPILVGSNPVLPLVPIQDIEYF